MLQFILIKISEIRGWVEKNFWIQHRNQVVAVTADRYQSCPGNTCDYASRYPSNKLVIWIMSGFREEKLLSECFCNLPVGRLG